MAVVLELKPVLAGVLQEKGLVLEHSPFESHFGPDVKGLTGLFDPLLQGEPWRCVLEDQSEMAGINPQLSWPWLVAVALQHQLVPAEIKD